MVEKLLLGVYCSYIQLVVEVDERVTEGAGDAVEQAQIFIEMDVVLL